MEDNKKTDAGFEGFSEQSFPTAPEQPANAPPPQIPMNPVHSVYAQPVYAPGLPVQGQPLPYRREKKTVSIDTKDLVFVVVTLLASVLFVRCSFFGGFNLGFTVSASVLFLSATLYTVKKGGRIGAFPLICGGFALLLSVPFSLYADNVIRFISVCGIVILTALFLGGLTNSLQCTDGSYMLLYDVLRIIVVYPFKHFMLFPNSMRGKSGEKVDMQVKKIGYILAGIAAAFPIVAIVVTLLINSDAAFESMVKLIFGNITNSLVSIAVGLLLALLLFPVLFALRKGVERLTDENRLTEKTFNVNTVLANTVLTLLSACYAMYLLSQTAYFFSAFSGLLPENYTPAEYARRGFFEMCAVVAINLIVFFAAYILTKRTEEGSLRPLTKGLLTFLSLFTLVLVSTAFSKMYLYIDRFGLTRPRVLTSAFMLVLFLIFITLMLRLYLKKLPYLKLAALITAVVLTGVSYLDVDTQIARYNTASYRNGDTAKLDVATIGNLSAASIPYLMELYNGGNREQSILAGYFLVNSVVRYGDYDYENESWSFNTDFSPISYNRAAVNGKKLLVGFYDELKRNPELYNAYFKIKDYPDQNQRYTTVLSGESVSPKKTDQIFVCISERQYFTAVLTVWHKGKPIICGLTDETDIAGYGAFEDFVDIQWTDEMSVSVTLNGSYQKNVYFIDLKKDIMSNHATDTVEDVGY